MVWRIYPNFGLFDQSIFKTLFTYLKNYETRLYLILGLGAAGLPPFTPTPFEAEPTYITGAQVRYLTPSTYKFKAMFF